MNNENFQSRPILSTTPRELDDVQLVVGRRGMANHKDILYLMRHRRVGTSNILHYRYGYRLAEISPVPGSVNEDALCREVSKELGWEYTSAHRRLAQRSDY